MHDSVCEPPMARTYLKRVSGGIRTFNRIMKCQCVGNGSTGSWWTRGLWTTAAIFKFGGRSTFEHDRFCYFNVNPHFRTIDFWCSGNQQFNTIDFASCFDNSYVKFLGVQVWGKSTLHSDRFRDSVEMHICTRTIGMGWDGMCGWGAGGLGGFQPVLYLVFVCLPIKHLLFHFFSIVVTMLWIGRAITKDRDGRL